MTMTTTAQRVAEICSGSNVAAATPEYGYAVHYDNNRTLFPCGRLLAQRRNREGRCTFARYAYSDGSTLEFHFHPNTGARFFAK